MRFFGIEQKDGLVRIPGPMSAPNMDYTEVAPLVAALALKLDASAYTAADVLAKLVTVDGAGSGLDADLLDGLSSAAFLSAATYTAADVLAKLITVDGAGSLLDADFLDGLSSAAFAAASHAHAQSDVTGLAASLALKLDAASYTAADVLAKLITVDGAGSLLDADLLDGVQGSDYARISAANTYLAAQIISNATPLLILIESDQSADEQIWAHTVTSKVYELKTFTAGFAASRVQLAFTRGTGATVTGIAVGNATDNATVSFVGTGAVSVGGALSVTGAATLSAATMSLATANRFVPNSSTIPTNGLYLPNTNNPGLSANSTKVIDWTSTLVTITGNVSLGTAGNKLLIKEGSNASMGVATLVLGTVVVSTTLVTATSRIQLTAQSLGTITVPSALAVSARTAGTSFTILASQLTDTSVVAWQITEPA